MDFKEHLLTFMDREEANSLLESFNNASISSFRLNSTKIDKIFDFIENNALEPLKHVKNAYYYNKEQLELGKSIYFYAGAYYIQEPAAMLVANLLNIGAGDKVLDMCAAPGGKSFNALLELNNTGLLVCNDINPLRAKILSSNIEKYGFTNTIVLNDNSANYKKCFSNYFDKIILDAPCSGSGMFRKDDFAIKDWSIDKVYKCKEIQQSLLEDAYSMLKGQGMMVYSTCSYSIQENEEVIVEFLNNHKDMELINISLNDEYNDSIGIHGGLRLYPFKYKGEGQVMFLLKKNSDDFNDFVFNKKKDSLYYRRIEQDVFSCLDELDIKYDKESVVKYKDQYYMINVPFFDFKGVNVIRYGLHLGYMENNRFIPSHSLAMSATKENKRLINLSYDDAKKYLQGYTLNNDRVGNGFAIVGFDNLPLGLVKVVNGQLKNHLPKGLKLSENLIK